MAWALILFLAIQACNFNLFSFAFFSFLWANLGMKSNWELLLGIHSRNLNLLYVDKAKAGVFGPGFDQIQSRN